MSKDYDCIDDEWREECGHCGNTFTNQTGGVECPHCEEEENRGPSRFGVFVEGDLFAKLLRLSKKRGCTMEDLVREAAEMAVEKE